MAARPQALVLYRNLLRTLQKWPSVRRDKVASEIREEFRQNRVEASPDKVEKMLAEAAAGLRSLRQQCGLNDGTDVSYMCDSELQRANRR